MSVTSDQLRELMALGIDGEKLLAVVTIFDTKPSRDGRDAPLTSVERSRRYRNKQRVAAVTKCDVTQSDEPSPSSPASPSPPITPLTPSPPPSSSASPSAARADDWPADYAEQFWKTYPNKVGRPKSLAKLDKIRKRGVLWAELWGGLLRYVGKTDDRPWCNPETWLNGERWSDQPATVNGNGQRTSKTGTYSAAGPAQNGADAILAGMANVARKRGLLEPADQSQDREFQRPLDLAGRADAD